MKKELFLVVLMVCGLALAVMPVSAVGSWTWGSGDPGWNPAAVVHNGVIPLGNLVAGDFRGSATSENAPGYGDSGVSVGWDDNYQMPVGDANTNGDAWDGKWVQMQSPYAGWWDLGQATDEVVVFTSQDHGGYISEGLEYRVSGSNSLYGATGSEAVVTDVYLDGWRTFNPAEDSNKNLWCSDDIAAKLKLDNSYRYVKVVAWATSGGLDEPEVDNVARVIPSTNTPEFPSALLPVTMIIGFLGTVLLIQRTREH